MQLLGILHFTTVKVRVGLGLQTIRPKCSTPHLGLEPVKAFCSMTYSEVELIDLSSPGSENRVICRAIGL